MALSPSERRFSADIPGERKRPWGKKALPEKGGGEKPTGRRRVPGHLSSQGGVRVREGGKGPELACPGGKKGGVQPARRKKGLYGRKKEAGGNEGGVSVEGKSAHILEESAVTGKEKEKARSRGAQPPCSSGKKSTRRWQEKRRELPHKKIKEPKGGEKTVARGRIASEKRLYLKGKRAWRESEKGNAPPPEKKHQTLTCETEKGGYIERGNEIVSEKKER